VKERCLKKSEEISVGSSRRRARGERKRENERERERERESNRAPNPLIALSFIEGRKEQRSSCVG